MKTTDETKKGLECHARPGGCDMGCPYVDVCNEYEGCPMCTDALALIQQLEAQNSELLKIIEQLQAELRDAKENHQHTIDIAERQKMQIGKLKTVIVKLNKGNVHRWISVEERLPEKGEKVIVQTTNRSICPGTYMHTSRNGIPYAQSGRGKSLMCYPFTHWMPLPEPPLTENK